MNPINTFHWQNSERSAEYRMWYSPDMIRLTVRSLRTAPEVNKTC